MTLAESIDLFFEHYLKSHAVLTTVYDPQWPSPCEIEVPFDGVQGDQLIRWQPVKRHLSEDDFIGLENALEMPIHPDVKTHFGAYWSANLEAKAPDGHVSLLYLWNPEDTDRLVENLIGHAVACKQNRTPFSVFFACTEPESDLFLTINNTTGQVQLEEPGKKPLRVVSDSLQSFMDSLVPAPRL
jgi:SecY interacting protein Syd